MLHLSPPSYVFPQKFFIEDFAAYNVDMEPSDWRREEGEPVYWKIVADAALPSGKGLQADATRSTPPPY